MKHLINREEYIKEYLRVCNQEMITDINNGQVENELYGVFLDCNNNKVNELKNM